MHRQARPPPDARVLNIRDYEDKLATLQACIQEHRQLGATAAWEQRTGARIEAHHQQQRFAALRAQSDASLAERRAALQHKLLAEEAALKQELVSSQETPAQRRATMAAQAHALAQRREAQRQQLATSLLDQAFRDNCDPLRERNSRRLVLDTAAQCEQQVQEKLALSVRAEEEDRVFDEMHAAEHMRMETRHLADVRRQQGIAGEVKSSLDRQVAAVRERQEAERRREALEVQRMQAHGAQLQTEAEAAERAERQRLQDLADDVKRFNERKTMQLTTAERQERGRPDDHRLAVPSHERNSELDLSILQQALAMEAAQEAAEIAAREAKRQATLQYRKQLAASMAKAQEDQGALEAAVDAANRQQQAKQDTEWAAREAARTRLMAQVHEIRQEQCAQKQQARLIAQEAKRLELLQLQEQTQQEAADAASRAAEARRKNLQQSLDIKTQMMARAHLKAAEVEEKQHAAELATASEARYQERVAAAGRQAAPQAYFGRKKVEWMH